jgi:hypothetical protein
MWDATRAGGQHTQPRRPVAPSLRLMTARDDLGTDVPVLGPARRVVSLVPSLTESVAMTRPGALVGGHRLVHPPVSGLFRAISRKIVAGCRPKSRGDLSLGPSRSETDRDFLPLTEGQRPVRSRHDGIGVHPARLPEPSQPRHRRHTRPNARFLHRPPARPDLRPEPPTPLHRERRTTHRNHLHHEDRCDHPLNPPGHLTSELNAAGCIHDH